MRECHKCKMEVPKDELIYAVIPPDGCPTLEFCFSCFVVFLKNIKKDGPCPYCQNILLYDEKYNNI